MGASLEPLVDPDLEVVAVGPEYTGEGTVHHGLTGYLEFWVDWLEPWESFRIEAEEYLDAGDKVVMLARQVGSTGRRVVISRVHLDRDRAMKVAGLAD